MSLIYFRKSPGGVLIPANESDVEDMQKYKNGDTLKCNVRKERNPKFHNKFFALLNFGYQYWSPPAGLQYNGFNAQRIFDRFRHDIIVAAGYYDVESTIHGTVILSAKSISFDKMDEGDFHRLYKSVFNAIWERVCSQVQNMTEREMENAINHLASFE